MPKKKYSINWENDEPSSFEVNRVSYESLDQVPDEADRSRLEAMMNASMDQEFEKEFEEFDREFEKEFEAHKKTSANAEKLILGIFSGVAMLMLLIAFISSASAILKMNREESAPGRVADIVQRREYVNEQDRVVQDYYFPVVEFVSSDGRRHSVQLTEGSSTPSHEVGDEVTVLYNPDQPLDARIKSFGSYVLMWILPGITGILGLGFLGAVLAVRKLMPSTENLQNELA
jgi:uncharacterized protein DUF3592